jgi:hypothetical protein
MPNIVKKIALATFMIFVMADGILTFANSNQLLQKSRRRDMTPDRGLNRNMFRAPQMLKNLKVKTDCGTHLALFG